MSGAAPDTFDAFLSRGIGPKVGMWRIPLPTQSYEHASKPLLSERLLNLMSEVQPGEARNEVALISTGGLEVNIAAGSFGGSPIVAMNGDLPGFLYVLAQGFFYRLSAGGIVNLGPAGPIIYDAGYGPSTMMSTIAVGTNFAVVCCPPDAWFCSHTDTGLTALNGLVPIPGFPITGARWVAQLAGYFIFGAFNQFDGFFLSLLLNPAAYSGFDKQSNNAVPNLSRGGWIVNRELWIAGEGGIEVWYLVGGAGFPLAPQLGAFIAEGPRSVRSVAVGKDHAGHQSLWWISVAGRVYRSIGYTAVPVSTPAIEAIIQIFGTAAISMALCYSQRGHEFYVFTIGILTLVYDATTSKWHNRSSSPDGLSPWRPSCSAQLGQDAIFGDSLPTGNTYLIKPDNDNDNGVKLLREAIMPPLWSRTSRESDNRLEIEMEVGGPLSPGDITLTWSNDGGITYPGGPRIMNAGTSTQTRKRVFTTRLGSFRQRVYRVSFLGHGTIYAVDVDRSQPMQGG